MEMELLFCTWLVAIVVVICNFGVDVLLQLLLSIKLLFNSNKLWLLFIKLSLLLEMLLFILLLP